jgi:hypothetical protein
MATGQAGKTGKERPSLPGASYSGISRITDRYLWMTCELFRG